MSKDTIIINGWNITKAINTVSSMCLKNMLWMSTVLGCRI